MLPKKQSLESLDTSAEVGRGVRRGGSAVINTDFGEFTFMGYVDANDQEHLAIVKGDVAGRDSVLCRVHSECLTGEVFHSRRCDCRPQLELAMTRLSSESGVIVYLRQEGRGIGLVNKLRAYQLQNDGADTLEANLQLGFAGDMRRYSTAAQILADLGVRSIVLMSNNPDKQAQLEHEGIRVVRRDPHVAGVHNENQNYLSTKRRRMGHDLDLD